MTGGPGQGLVPLHGILVTYRRNHLLPETLAALLGQSHALASLTVVDNADDLACRRVVEASTAGHGQTVVGYIASSTNSGPAGGLAQGMAALLAWVPDDHWVVGLDDDNPPDTSQVLHGVAALAWRAYAEDPRTGAVGLVGARFDKRRGRLARIPSEELVGLVDVDYVGGDHYPTVRVSALRDAGVYDASLFFGFDDLEHGLRLRKAGYRVTVDGADMLAQRRRWEGTARPDGLYAAPAWRDYYSVRNRMHLLKTYASAPTAARVAIEVCVLKPLLHARHAPHESWSRARLAVRAARDGWTGRLGRTVEPG